MALGRDRRDAPSSLPPSLPPSLLPYHLAQSRVLLREIHIGHYLEGRVPHPHCRDVARDDECVSVVGVVDGRVQRVGH